MTRKKARLKHLSVPARRTQPGAMPGTVAVDPSAPAPQIHVMRFSSTALQERTLQSAEEIDGLVVGDGVMWVNVAGLGDATVIERVGRVLGMHSLSIEDVVNVHQRPKLEDYGDYLYVVLRQASSQDPAKSEQISVLFGPGVVATFHEDSDDCFEPVRTRIRKGQGRLRSAGSDYLAYSLLDAIVDNYFPLLEYTSDRLEILEEEVVASPRHDFPGRVLALRHELLGLRRVIWPLREVLSALYRDDTPLIVPETRVYLRDCYDHVVQLIDVLESHREVAGGLMDVYLSSVSNRMNEVMKVLTVIATVFIPLTFVSSIYGMNFDPKASPWNMPELEWKLGYPFALLVMSLIAAGLLYYFRRRGWLGSSGGDG